MMANFVWAIGASIAVSLISLAGIFSLLFREGMLENSLLPLIGFSAGGLIGAAFLHLLPEALETANSTSVFTFVIAGFIFFLVLEKYLHWRHCHKGKCETHAFTYLNLVGDGVHNFTDGLAIAASFAVSIDFGVVTTLVIIFHEIPQEIGDFAVLVYGGFSKSKALFYNFLTALTCVAGTAIGYPLASRVKDFSVLLIPLIAGGFIYIAACDLIPELHKQPGLKKSSVSVFAFLCGIAFVVLAKMVHLH